MLLHNATKKKFIMIIMFCLSLLLTACGGQNASTKIVLTTGFAKNEVFRIENKSCKLPEVMVYLTCMQNQYTEVFGEEIRQVSLEGVTFEENLKETVLARIAQVKTLNLLAEKKQISLNDDEIKAAGEAAEAYYRSLSKKEVETLGVTKDILFQMYSEYALAEKTYAYIIQDINPEISDDEARIVRVMDIYIKTYTRDGTGERIEYTDQARNQAYLRAKEAYELVTEVGQPFEKVMEEYSEKPPTELSFGKGEMSEILEEAAFNMGNGEIRGIIEDEDGYHILKCVSTFDREETDRNKAIIMEERKKQVFDEEYDVFVEGLTRRLNEKLWEEVSCIQDDEVRTSLFFEIFNNYFR